MSRQKDPIYVKKQLLWEKRGKIRSISTCSRGNRDNCADNSPFLTWTIEFTEKDILPSGQAQLTVDERNCFRWADQAGLEVGVAVAVLLVVQPDTAGNELCKQVDHIGLYRVVPVFLDHDGPGCALGIDAEYAILNAAFIALNGPSSVGVVM